MAEIRPPPASPAVRRHWRATRRLTAVLLVAWAVAAFVLPWFARDLSFRFLGFPFGFWEAAQGGCLAFLAIVVLYAFVMRRLDRRLREDLAAEDAARRERAA